MEQEDSAFLDDLQTRFCNRRHKVKLTRAERERLRTIATTAGVAQWPAPTTQLKLHAFVDKVRNHAAAGVMRRLRGNPTLDMLDRKYRGTTFGTFDLEEYDLACRLLGVLAPNRWYSPPSRQLAQRDAPAPAVRAGAARARRQSDARAAHRAAREVHLVEVRPA